MLTLDSNIHLSLLNNKRGSTTSVYVSFCSVHFFTLLCMGKEEFELWISPFLALPCSVVCSVQQIWILSLLVFSSKVKNLKLCYMISLNASSLIYCCSITCCNFFVATIVHFRTVMLLLHLINLLIIFKVSILKLLNIWYFSGLCSCKYAPCEPSFPSTWANHKPLHQHPTCLPKILCHSIISRTANSSWSSQAVASIYSRYTYTSPRCCVLLCQWFSFATYQMSMNDMRSSCYLVIEDKLEL